MKNCPICTCEFNKLIKFYPNSASLFGCQKCQAVYWEDSWDKQKVESHYAKYYNSENSQDDAITQKRYHQVLGTIEKLKPVGKLLDVGCGAGQLLITAEMRGWKALGSEISQSAIEHLQHIKKTRQMKFELIDKNIHELNLPPNSIDVVCMIEVIEHLEDPMAMLGEIHRILNKGGILYITTPNFNSLSRFLSGNNWHLIGEEHRVLFTPKTLRTSLSLNHLNPNTILTKNIDIPAILSKFKHITRRNFSQSSTQLSKNLRCAIEKNHWLHMGKSCMNTILRLFSMGDTIEAFAIKK